MEQLNFGDRSYILRRFPLKKADRLRAWDAGDEYLLNYLDEQDLLHGPEPSPPTGDLLVVNDGFGALMVALHDQHPVAWSDSFLSRLALRYNLLSNRLTPRESDFVPGDEIPSGSYRLAVVKLPKNLSFFEDQLLRLRGVLQPGAKVVVGGMIKHTPKRAYELLAEIIGPTTTTLGWKKARLAVSNFEDRPDLAPSVPPSVYELPGTDIELTNLPNVFSREKPDLGTRLLLTHLPRTSAAIEAVDLGCGNGILSLALAQNCPAAQILGVDESYQAIASARMNAASLVQDGHRLQFLVSDGLNDEPEQSRDLVVCNPPFHQGQVTGDLPAWSMFAEARHVLRPGGELWVVGNRHLGYHAKLKRLFTEVELKASNKKFVVLKAVKGHREMVT